MLLSFYTVWASHARRFVLNTALFLETTDSCGEGQFKEGDIDPNRRAMGFENTKKRPNPEN